MSYQKAFPNYRDFSAWSHSLEARPIIDDPATVDSTIEIGPLAMNVDIGIIEIPGSSCLSTPLSSELISYQGSKAHFPLPHRLMREHKASLQKHCG
jgi:hypothetical protein